MSTFVLPGDRLSIPSSSNVKLGPGLAVPNEQEKGDNHVLSVTLPGFLGQVINNKGKGKADLGADHMQVDGASQSQQVAHWVESNSVRYLPALHDPVICQITNRGTESYQVTLFNSYTSATLSAFAFEGATKRNKPNLKVGTILYAQVMSANRHLEVELTCVDQSTGKSNGYGELKSEGSTTSSGAGDNASGESTEVTAMIWKVSCGLSRSLLKPSHTLLSRLASHFPFEVAVGVNGYVWVRASQAKHVVALGKVLQRADQVKGSLTNNQEPSTALQIARNRGVLSVEEIASIVRSFK